MLADLSLGCSYQQYAPKVTDKKLNIVLYAHKDHTLEMSFKNFDM